MSQKISKFKVENFRNLNFDFVELHPNLNFIFGDNGNGKTNFLESVYVALSGKSFKKNVSFPQLISFDKDFQELLFGYLVENDYISGRVTAKKSEWFKNNKGISKKDARLSSVFIGAHDPHLFFSSPQSRRDWFDDQISKLDKNYENALYRYKKLLRSRNKLLSGPKSEGGLRQISAIDTNLSSLIPLLEVVRERFIEKIEDYLAPQFQNIFQEMFEIKLILNSKFKDLSEKIVYNYLQDHLSKDLILGYTGIGPQRDDYEVAIDGLDVLDFASLGQQKVIYLSLVFSFIRIMEEKQHLKPIILMDDLSNEIDNKRWKSLIEFLIRSNYQVLITSANKLFLQSISSELMLKSFEIISGKIVSGQSI